MRDQTIIGLVEKAMEDNRKVFEVRMAMYERLIKEITEELGGIFFLINSIPILGILLRKLIERKIRQFQKVLKAESIKLYQKQKKEIKNGLDSNEGKNKGKPEPTVGG